MTRLQEEPAMHLQAAELLLKQFLRAGDEIISKTSPQDSFVTLVSDPRFGRSLASLRLLVRHHLPLLVRQLEYWRKSSHATLARMPERTERERMVVFSKRAAMEVVYFEAALQLLDEYSDDFLKSPEFVAYYDGLQQTAVSLLLISDEQFPPELASLYRLVVGVVARVLGAVSRKVSLKHVVEPFLRALSDRINPRKDPSGAKPNYDVLRAQIVRLASGMRHVVLSFDSEAAVREAVDFLRRAHPLAHTAPVKKSQIHHALADMLTSILLPLVRSDAPQRAAASLGLPALEQWYGIVLSTRNDITNWMNKHQKHVNDGYPLSTTLVCLASDRDYSAHIDLTADFLQKGLKVKENRAVCVRCLVVLACSYLVRYGAHIIKHELHKWLDRVLKPVTALAKKGGLTIAEQLDVIAPIAELSPEFAVQYLVLELLTSDTPDCLLAGLRALQALILTAPAVAASAAAAGVRAGAPTPPQHQHHRSSSGAPGMVQPGGGGGFPATPYGSGGGAGLPSNASSSGLQALVRRTQTASLGGVLYGSSASSVLAGATSAGGASGASYSAASGAAPAAAFAAVTDLLRQGVHPLEVLGVAHLLPRISAALSKLLASWHTLYGCSLMYGPVDPNWKEKAAGMPLLLTLVRLLPYLKPETWTGVRPLDQLPIYTCHVEGSMRSVAVEALQALVRGSPHLRNSVLCAFAAFTAGLPDDAVQAQRESQALWRGLMELWGGLLAERAAGDALELTHGSAEALSLDVHRLEGYALVCLTSHDEGVRREALHALSLIRSLHRAVLSADPYDPPASPMGRNPAVGAAAGTPAPGGVSRHPSNGGLAISGGATPGPGGRVGHHGPSASKESFDLAGAGLAAEGPPALGGPRGSAAQGLPDAVDPDLTYVADLVEEAGPAMLRATYWDFLEVSDLWRQYRPVPAEVAFEDVLTAATRAGDDVSRVRLARSLLELLALAVRLCPLSAGVAGAELMARLARMLGRNADGRLVVLAEYMDTSKRDAWRNCSAAVCAVPQSLRDKLGRRSLPVTSRDVIRVHLSLLTTPSSSQTGPMATIQLCSMLSLGHLSPDMYGVLLEEMQPYMDEFMGSRGFSGGSSKSKSKGRDEIRRSISHVYRILAERVPPEVLSGHPQLRSRMVEFIRDTYAFLRPNHLSTDAFWDAAQVAYCLTSVVRSCAVPLRALLSQPAGGGTGGQQLSRDSQGKADGSAGAGGGAGSASLRKLLWELILVWSEEAYILLRDIKALIAALPPGADAAIAIRQSKESNYNRAVTLGINSLLARYKESPEGMREELHLTAHSINHSARLALAALVEGPAFDTETRRPTGPIFTWIDKLLAVQSEGPQQVVVGPQRRDVGHRALRALLTHNPDLFDVSLDKCYDSNASIASGYFQVMCEVYATQPVRCPAHVVLALVLVKLVDPGQEVREDAMHMLHVLSQREWQSGAAGTAADGAMGLGADARSGPGGAAEADGAAGASAGGAGGGGGGGGGADEAVVVLGALQDSYQQFQYELACRLARDHPELSEALCEEMMTRQLECDDGLIQHPVLTSLAPWMENLVISFPWKGNWSERLLKSMYYVTLRHGTQFPFEIERLWTQLAKRTRNINPVLDFLLHLGMEIALQTDLLKLLEYLGVGKRIVLYLARVSPAETIGYLAIELAKQQLEEDQGGAAAEAAAAGPSQGRAAGAAQGSGRHQQQQQVLVFGGALDCLVAGERTLHASYESLASASSRSIGGAAASGSAGPESISAVAAGGGSAASAAVAANRNRSLDAGRSEASGDSRSDVNGGSVGPASVADSATTQPKGAGGADAKLRPADDSSNGGAGAGQGGADMRGSPTQSRAQSAAGALQSSGNRVLLTRPELVLCCLAEVVYEHEVDPQHLPLLLHVAVTCGDHEEPVLAAHCQQLVINLLYSLSARFIEAAGGDAPAATTPGAAAGGGGGAASGGPSSGGASAALATASGGGSDLSAVTSLIRHLQSMRGRRLWPWEEYSLAGGAAVAAAASADGHLLSSSAALGALTLAVTEALSYEPDLAEEWAQRALDWAQHARSRHAACRSWQVLRALRPPLKAELAAALVLSLEAAFQSGYTSGCEVAVEIITTTRVLVQALPPGRLVLYPQVWWSALALLHSPHVAVYRGALGLLAVCLGGGHLRLAAAKVQAVLLAAAPGLSAGQLLAVSHAAAVQEGADDADPWVLGQHVLNVRESGSPASHGSIAVQQLLLRGLMHPLTVLPTLHLVAAFGEALAHQAGMLLARGSPAASAGGAAAVAAAGVGRPDGILHGRQQPSAHQLMPLATGGIPTSGMPTAPPNDTSYDTGGSGAGATGGSGGAAVVPHSDSLRKHRALKLDSFQTLLGSCRSQLFVSLMGVLPLVLSLHGSGGGGSSSSLIAGDSVPHPHSHPSHRSASAARGGPTAVGDVRGSGGVFGGAGAGGADAEELEAGIAVAVAALGRAAGALGMAEVGTQLQVLSSPQIAHDPELLESATTQLLSQLARALFPRYARWFLHHIADLLLGGTAPGTGSAGGFGAQAGQSAAAGAAANGNSGSMPHAPRQVRAALLMLKCLFRVEGLRLGPAAAALVAEGTLLQPVVGLVAGPLGPEGMEALAAAVEFSQEPGFQADLAAAVAGGIAGSGTGQQQHVPRTLFPPPTPVAVALKKVVDTLGSSMRRRNKHMKLLPFLGSYNE